MTEPDDDLKMFLAAARRDGADLPEGVMTRIIADADRVRVDRASGARPRGLWQQFSDLLGGWPGLGGLVTACAVGVWLGFAPPSGLPDPVDYLVPQYSGVADLADLTGFGTAVDPDELDLFDTEALTSALTEEG